MDPTTCTVNGCTQDAVSWLRFAGMGNLLHVHVCAPHEALDREYTDVIESGQLPCPPRLLCTPTAVAHRIPPLLPDAELA